MCVCVCKYEILMMKKYGPSKRIKKVNVRSNVNYGEEWC